MSLDCPYCPSERLVSSHRPQVLKIGSYFRKSDQKLLQRYICTSCKKSFSDATQSRCLHQKKRQLNSPIFQLLCSGVSQRRASRYLNINRKTIARKLVFLGLFSRELLPRTNSLFQRSQVIEFDDLETFEHSQCKPLSVTMAVEHKTRRILGFKVARMPAKGLLASVARKKYGFRKDERALARRELFSELQSLAEEKALFKSDEHPGYPKDLRKYFPHSQHKRYKSRRACAVGQGELKEGKFDPLFSLNHSFAMLRANINRLYRRSWNTTKDPKRLEDHISIYALYHNLVLIRK